MSKCFADGCERNVPTSMLMCREHWSQVPRDIQDEVYAAYRERRRQGDGLTRRHSKAMMAAKRSLR